MYMKLCAVDEVDKRKIKSDKLNTSVMDSVLLVIKLFFWIIIFSKEKSY